MLLGIIVRVKTRKTKVTEFIQPDSSPESVPKKKKKKREKKKVVSTIKVIIITGWLSLFDSTQKMTLSPPTKSKSATEILEKSVKYVQNCQWRRSGVFFCLFVCFFFCFFVFVNFEHILCLFLGFLLLTLNR